MLLDLWDCSLAPLVPDCAQTKVRASPFHKKPAPFYQPRPLTCPEVFTRSSKVTRRVRNHNATSRKRVQRKQSTRCRRSHRRMTNMHIWTQTLFIALILISTKTLVYTLHCDLLVYSFGTTLLQVTLPSCVKTPHSFIQKFMYVHMSRYLAQPSSYCLWLY